VLWGTLSPTVRSDPAALKAYFVGAFQALPKATVKFGDQLIRVYGNTAVNTGYYTFSYTKDGENQIDSGPLQLHLCEGRQRLEDRRPPLVRGASAAQVSAGPSRALGRSDTDGCEVSVMGPPASVNRRPIQRALSKAWAG
jgi:hypothetical protein